MSAKPYHAGHDGLIRTAAAECDDVIVFVSLSDRKRPGETIVRGADMAKIWHDLIEPTLPANVRVVYGGSPITNLWAELGRAESSRSPDTYLIFSDPTDMAQRFGRSSMEKYAGELARSGRVVLRPIRRTSTVNVSGTMMRSYLASGDMQSFIANMPSTIDAVNVWKILRAGMMTELRTHVRTVMHDVIFGSAACPRSC